MELLLALLRQVFKREGRLKKPALILLLRKALRLADIEAYLTLTEKMKN
jgi:hypothetical protein